jgi:polyisoprenoid-binding protein YceI
LKTGSKLEDLELERQLQVRKFPRIRGEVREVAALKDGTRYRVRGDLSLRGVTQTLDGEVTLRAVDEKTVQVDGEQTLDVRDFGLQPPKILMLQVNPEVHIRARIIAVREG